MSSWIVEGNLAGKLSIGQGERGKSLEYKWRGTWLGIRQEGETEYKFVNLAGEGTGSSGIDGREVELQVGNGYIQWRYKDEEEWNNLVAIADLKGDRGEQGIQGLPGKDGTNGQDGVDGVDGKEGVTPNITIGTVATLEAGQKATVVNSGTKENPIFDFGIPKGESGSNGVDGVTPDMSDFENKINNQYDVIKAKVDKIEQENSPVEIPIVDNTLTLTKDKRQKTTMKNNTTIVLPDVDKFTEIHLKFSTTEELTLILPKIKWQSDINIEANKTYEFIFTYDDEWLGGVIIYK